MLIGRSKCREFRTIKEKIWSLIKGWGGRLLSRYGKAIMIQAVAQAIPLYVISCFKLPKRFLYNLNMLFAGYCGVINNIKGKFNGRIGIQCVVQSSMGD